MFQSINHIYLKKNKNIKLLKIGFYLKYLFCKSLLEAFILNPNNKTLYSQIYSYSIFYKFTLLFNLRVLGVKIYNVLPKFNFLFCIILNMKIFFNIRN